MTPTPSQLPDYTIAPPHDLGDSAVTNVENPQSLSDTAHDSMRDPGPYLQPDNLTGGGVPHPHNDDPLTNFQYEAVQEQEAEGEHRADEIRGAESDEWNHSENRGEDNGERTDTGHTNIAAEHPTDDNAIPPPAPTRNLLDMFRNGVNTAVTLMTRSTPTKDHQDTHTPHAHSALNITVREAIRTRGTEAENVIMKELSQMITKKVWTPVDGRSLTAEQRYSVIRSSMFLKEKFFATGEFEKLKARLVAGGDQQDKDLYDDLSAPTVSTSSVFTILSIAAHENRSAAVVDIGGAFLNAEMKTGVDVHMRLDKTISDLMIRLDGKYKRYQDGRGCITVLLDRALYGCVESAALWYENLRDSMSHLGYTANPYDICVFNRTNDEGVQCTATVHVDDLLIVSTDRTMIDQLAEGLRTR